MPLMTGKQAFMEMLQAEGVRYIFGNPGTSESAIMSSLPAYRDIKYVLVTQEGVAMGMADGYGCATGSPSLVNLHIDTGLANGVSLLHHAMDGGVPLVLTAGNKDIRKFTEGRSDLVEMVRQFTKWSGEVTHPEQLPGMLRRAFNEAKTPPTGPTFVDFAANALEDTAEMEIVPSPTGYFRLNPDPTAVQAAAELLSRSTRPIMVVGDRLAQSQGVAAAVRLAELLGARVYTTSYARMNFPSGHPQFLGRINPTLPASRELLSAGDVVLAVGTNVFSGFFYFPRAQPGPLHQTHPRGLGPPGGRQVRAHRRGYNRRSQDSPPVPDLCSRRWHVRPATRGGQAVRHDYSRGKIRQPCYLGGQAATTMAAAAHVPGANDD